jgi:hypothetical protein
MTRTALLLSLIIITALASIPAQAQPLRVFVSGLGLDTNPCTVTQPCRTFQQAYNVAAANGEIDVLDPAGYGPLTITHGISIQAHGFGGITQTSNSGAAIIVNVTTSDPVTLDGLVLDGGGTGFDGIFINSGPPPRFFPAPASSSRAVHGEAVAISNKLLCYVPLCTPLHRYTLSI